MQTQLMNSALGAQRTQAALAGEQARFQRLEQRGRSDSDAGLHFEALLATMMAKELRSGLEEGFFGSGPGADTFSAWLDEHVGRVMAERGAFGIAEIVDREMQRTDGDDAGGAA